MTKLKILVPLDGTEKSMHSIVWLKKFFSKEDAEVTLIHVVEALFPGQLDYDYNPENAESISNKVLDAAAKELEGYKVELLSMHGSAPDIILNEAKEGGFDMVIMTKSSVKGIARIIGSVTTKVVRDSVVSVVIVPE
jgi:nucleotide-binding universal stress UspA family protein